MPGPLASLQRSRRPGGKPANPGMSHGNGESTLGASPRAQARRGHARGSRGREAAPAPGGNHPLRLLPGRALLPRQHRAPGLGLRGSPAALHRRPGRGAGGDGGLAMGDSHRPGSRRHGRHLPGRSHHAPPGRRALRAGARGALRLDVSGFPRPEPLLLHECVRSAVLDACGLGARARPGWRRDAALGGAGAGAGTGSAQQDQRALARRGPLRQPCS